MKRVDIGLVILAALIVAVFIMKMASGATLSEVLTDNRTYVYDDSTVPQVIQDDHGLLFPLRTRFSSRSRYDGAAVNPNLMNPWRTNGGLERVEHTGKKLLWIPEGTWIEVHTRRSRFIRSRKNITRTYATFPNGTVVAEFLYDRDGRLFEVRSREKQGGSWREQEQIFYGSRPPGYQQVTNCTQCHQDIAGHQTNWATTIRGLERGGPIHWHPWETRSVYRTPGQLPKIRDDVKHFVRWRR